MADTINITQRELYIRSVLSVICRNWTENDIQKSHHNVIYRSSDVFVCVLEGKAIYEIDGQQFPLCAGDVFFLPNGCSYKRYIQSQQYKNIYIDFLFDTPAGGKLSYKFFPSIEGIDLSFIKMYKKWIFRNSSYRCECMSVLYSIYARLIDSELLSYMPKAKKELFEAAIRTVSESYAAEELSVAMLAEQAQMSEVHFRKCFRKIYNVSPQQYIIDLRIAHAKELLQYHSDSVHDIAQSVGFSDACYFSRIFKQKTGYSPLEYRKAYANTVSV